MEESVCFGMISGSNQTLSIPQTSFQENTPPMFSFLEAFKTWDYGIDAYGFGIYNGEETYSSGNKMR